MKYVLVIPDGMGDNPVEALGGKTPLEAADTPNMDFFARSGVVGLSRNIPRGFVPGTDIGCMSVFGYDPRRYFTGRGPLEAAELGIELKKNEIAFRCNLVTLKKNILLDFSADHITTAEAAQLLATLDAKLRKKFKEKVRFYPGKGTGYRNLMVCADEKKSLEKVCCTPPHDIMGKPFRQYLPTGAGANFLSEIMTESQKIFAAHPVNRKRSENGRGEASMVWLWGQGRSPKFPSYHQRFGFHGGVITAVDLVKGIAIHAGLDVIKVPGVTGYFDTNYAGKADYAINALRSRDFVAIHIESTDEAGHIGDAALKIKAIEDVDRWVLGPLRQALGEFGEYKIMILPDHYTCVESRTHSSHPVPFLVYSSKKSVKGPKKFCEKTAAKTGLVAKEGHRLMEYFIEAKDCFGGPA